MKIESKKLLSLIAEEKIKLNDEETKHKNLIGIDGYADYYNGYICALSNVEGIIAKEVNDLRKCGGCKWLGDEGKASFRRCQNPYKRFRTKTSHLKYSCSLACKLYEGKDEEL